MVASGLIVTVLNRTRPRVPVQNQQTILNVRALCTAALLNIELRCSCPCDWNHQHHCAPSFIIHAESDFIPIGRSIYAITCKNESPTVILTWDRANTRYINCTRRTSSTNKQKKDDPSGRERERERDPPCYTNPLCQALDRL